MTMDKTDTIDWTLPYPSQRMPMLARNVVATSQPLAAQAGLRMLLKGGNAVDAAVAAAIAATVVEPTANGIGGDAFVLVWDGAKLHGLNASGRSPLAWAPERFTGLTAMPPLGWDAVTVPGGVSAWVALSKRFGKLRFEELFFPAIDYARNGFLVSPTVARQWAAQAPLLGSQPGYAAAFMPNGRPPRAGERFALPDAAQTLELIAETRGEAFYRGAISRRIADDAQRHGAALSEEDFARHEPFWTAPISQNYRGYTLHEMPPNGQGLAALIALGILEHVGLQRFPVDSADSIHVQIEAMKLAFADVYAHVSDPAYMRIDCSVLLDDDYLASRARLIDMRRARWEPSGVPRNEGTVYLTTADANGMMVSFMQSNYRGFGSGVVVPGTGVSLNNRGSAFSLEAGHPNRVGGGKLPFHTIIPGFLTQAGAPVMSFGVMGANMQPQGQVQMVTRVVDYGQNIQAAADAPRWKVTEDQLGVMVEPGFDPGVLDELATRGHRLTHAGWDSTEFGAAQLIHRLPDGYAAASERRRDGQAVGF
jgi:gamma-glutamyltranspeptidase / glutathione hydrolase